MRAEAASSILPVKKLASTPGASQPRRGRGSANAGCTRRARAVRRRSNALRPSRPRGACLRRSRPRRRRPTGCRRLSDFSRPGLRGESRFTCHFSNARADARRRRPSRDAGSRGACRPASWRCSRAPASPERRAGRRSTAAHATRTNAAARAGALWSRCPVSERSASSRCCTERGAQAPPGTADEQRVALSSLGMALRVCEPCLQRFERVRADRHDARLRPFAGHAHGAFAEVHVRRRKLPSARRVAGPRNRKARTSPCRARRARCRLRYPAAGLLRRARAPAAGASQLWARELRHRDCPCSRDRARDSGRSRATRKACARWSARRALSHAAGPRSGGCRGRAVSRAALTPRTRSARGCLGRSSARVCALSRRSCAR